METINGDFERDGPPPPSPLTGCYLLIVVGEPHSEEHRDIVLQRIVKGLLSWNVNQCLVDLEKELELISEQALEGEEARHGERLIQFASENLVTEILIHPVISTLVQCMRNLLSSFTRHRHIIHAGYTFAANGSWALQDGTFSYADFAEAFLEIETQRVIHAYENGISLDLHCSQEGDWCKLPKESFTKGCNVRVNPTDVLTCGSPSITGFINYVSQFLIPMSLENLLQCSDVVGNIRFSRPTLYVFPGGQGDAALFGVNGFNMLLDGGFSRKACFWDFVRHLDRLDAVLMTRLNNSNIGGISSILRRKRKDAVYPHLGHFFCNIQDRKTILSPDGDKDRDPLLIDLLNEGQEIISNLHHLNLNPQTCYRDPEPINLYHKVGHGTLNMYVLNPAKDSKEVKEFIQRWNQCDQKLFSKQQTTKFSFPVQNLISIAVLLIWQPANISDTITRILYPGSSPQQKIFEGLERLKNIEFVKQPVCSEKSLFSKFVAKKSAKHDTTEKVILKDKPAEKKEKLVVDNNINAFGGEIKERNVKKSDSLESERARNKKIEENKIITENNEKLKMKTKKFKIKNDLQQRKKSVEKTDSPTTPKKSIDQEGPKKTITSTPAKSTKDANNRKVIENKAKSLKSAAEPRAKLEKKTIAKKPKTLPKTPISPAKRMTNGLQKVDRISDRQKAKLEKDGTTDSSTVSTPTADQDSLKKDISNLSSEQIQQLKAQELADLQEEQEAIKEIEAVFRKGEAHINGNENMRKVKSISIDEDKSEKEEYLIIEREETDFLDEKEKKEIEFQKLTKDSEESEKQKGLIIEDNEQNQQSIKEAKTVVKTKESVDAVTKDAVITSQEEKVEILSSEKKSDKEAEVKDIVESHPDEKMSANIKSGDTTTAPTLPEDERIPLDEIKEDNGYPIEEKYVREETKEKGLPIIQLPAKTFDSVPKTPGVVGIRLDKQSHIRDIVKTPDEVADLPVHEEVDYEYAHESKTEIKINDAIVENVKSNEDEMRESKGEEKEIVECPAKEIYEKADKEVMETKPKELLEEKDQEIDVKTTDLDVDKSQKQSVMKDKEIQSKEGESHRTDDIVKTEAAAKDIKQVLGTEQEIITKTEETSEDIKKLDQPHEEIQLKGDSKKKDILKFEEEKKDSDKNIIDSSSVKSEHVELTKGDIEQDKVIEHEIKEKSEPEQIKKKDTGTEEVCKSLQEEKGSDKSSTDTSSYKLGTTELTKEQTKQHEEVEEKQQKEKSHEMKDKSSVSLQIEKEGSTLKEISKVDEEKKDIEKSTTSSDISGETEHREQHEKVEEKPQEVKEESVKPEQIKKEDFEKEQSKEIEDKQHEMKEEPLASENVEKEDSKAKEISKSEEEEKVSDKRITEASSFKSGDIELSKEQTKHHTEIEEKQREMKEEPLIFKKMEKKVSKLKETSSSEEEEKTSDKSITETSSVKSGDTELSKELLGHDGKIEEKHEIKEEPLIFEKMGKKYFRTEEISKSEEVEENSDKSMVKEHTKQHEVEHKQYEEKPHEIKEMSSKAQQIEKEESTIKKISKFEEEKKDSVKSTTEISSGISGETEFTKEDKEQYEDIEQKPQELNEKSFVSEQIDQKDSNKEEVSKDEKTEEGSDKSIIQTKSNLTELSKEHTKQHQQIDEKLDETKDKLPISEQMKKEDIKPEEVVKFEQQIKDIDKSIIETQSFISAETELIKQHDLEGTEGEMKPHEIEENISITQQIKKQAEQSDVTKDEMKEIPSILEKGIMEDSKIEEIHKFGEEKESSDKSTTEISSFNSGETELAEKHTQQYEKDKLSEQIKEKESETEEVCKSEAVKKGGEIEEKPQQIQKEDSKIEQISKFEEEKKDSGKSFAETSSDISEKTEVKEKSPLSQQIENEDSKIEKTSKFDVEKYSDKIISEHTEEHEAIEEKAHGVKEVSLISEKRERKDSKTPEISESEEEKPTAISSSKPHGVKEESLISEKRERKDSETPEISKSEEEKPTAISSSKPHGVKEESLTSEKRERKDSETPEISKSEEEKPTAISSSKPHRVKEESLISEKRERKDSEAPEISKSEEEKPTAISSSKPHGVKEESLISEKRERKDSETPEISKSEEEKPTAISSSKPHGVKEESLTSEKRERKDSETPEISKSEEEKPTAISSSKTHGVKEESLISEKRERKESETPEISKSGEEMPTAISSSKPHGVKEESLIYEKRERKDSETPEISKSEEEKPTAISSSKPHGVKEESLISEKRERKESETPEISKSGEEMPTAISSSKPHGVKEESLISEKRERKDSETPEISKSEEEKPTAISSSKSEKIELIEHSEQSEAIEEKKHEEKEESHISEKKEEKDSKPKEISKSEEEEKASDKSIIETSFKPLDTELSKHTEHIGKIKEEPHEITSKSSVAQEIKKDDSKIKEISKFVGEEKGSDKCTAETSPVKSGKTELIKGHTEHYEEIEKKPVEMKEESSDKIEIKDFKAKDISKIEEEKEDSCKRIAETSVKSEKIELIEEHTEHHDEIQDKQNEIKEESLLSEKVEKKESETKEISKSKDKKEKDSDITSAQISPIKSGETDFIKEHTEQSEKIEEKPHGAKEESHIIDKLDVQDYKIKEISKSEEKEKGSDNSIAAISPIKSGKIELTKEHIKQPEDVEEKPHGVKEESHISEKQDGEDSKIKEVSKSEEEKEGDKTIAEILAVKTEKNELIKEHTEQFEAIEEKPYAIKEEFHIPEKLDMKDSKIKAVSKSEKEKKDSDESIAEISTVKSGKIEHTEDHKDIEEKPHRLKEESHVSEKLDVKDSKIKEVPKFEEEKCDGESIAEISALGSETIELTKDTTDQYEEIGKKPHAIEEVSLIPEDMEKKGSKTKDIPPKSEEEEGSDKSIVETFSLKSGQIDLSKEHTEPCNEIKEQHGMIEKTSEEIKKGDSKIEEISLCEKSSDKSSTETPAFKSEQIESTKEFIQHEKIGGKLHEMKEESTSEQLKKEDLKMKEESKLEEKKDSETSPLGEIALTKEEKDKKVESKIHEMKEESSISEQITKEDSKIEFAEKDKQSKLIRDGLEEFEEKPQEIKDSVSEQIKKKEVEHSKETPKYEDDKIQPKEVKSEVLDKKTTAEQIIEEDLKTREADDDDTDEERSTDKIETVGKLPKDREEDVIKIVATVAEVLKSDAPLEEFEGKLPISFDACKTAYVTELRETHITTTELPDETGIPPIPEESSTSLRSETDEEIKKSFEEAVTIPKILPDDIKEALEKELSDIEDQKTVQRMLVTASSEDGGEEIEICPVGTIIFSKSSESSGRSSPEKSQESKKSSIVDTISDSLTTVKQYTEAELDADIGNVNSEQDYLISDDRTKDKEEVTSLGDMAIEQTDQKYLKEDMEDGMEDELQKEEIKEGEQKGTEISSYVRDEKLTGEVHLPEVCSKIVDGKEEEEMEDTKIKPHSEKDILSSSVEGIKDSSTSKVSETISDKTVEAKGIKEDSTVSEKPLELKSTEKVKDSVDVGIDEKRTAPTSDITTAVIDINGDHTLPEKELPIKPKDYVDMGQSVSDKVHTIAFRDIPEKSLDKKTEDHADRIIHEDSSPPTPPEKLSGLITKTEVDVAKPVDEDKKIISTSDISHSEKELPKKIEDHVDVDGSVDEDKKIASTSDKLHAIDFKGDKVHPEKPLEMGVTEVHADVIKLADKDKKSVPTSDVCSDPLDQKASESATETKKMDHTCEISDGSKTPIEKSEDEKERKEDKHDLVTETVTSLLGKSEKEGSSEIDMKSGSSKEIKQPVQESEIVLQKEIGREGQKQDDKDFKSQDKRDLSESVLQGKSIAPPPDAVSSDESGKSSVTKDVKEKPKTDSTPLDTFFEDSVLKDKRHSKDTDLMCESFYGTLPGDESEESEESQLPPSCLYELTNAKYISECSASTADKIDASEGEKSETEISKTADTSSGKIQKESAEAGECLDNKLEAKTSSLYLYELTKAKEYIRSRVDSESEKKADKIASWGKPLGLPSPAPMTDNKGTPKKERKLPLNISVKNKWNDDKKRSESPSKTKNKKLCPIYVDLTYVPHHGNSYYSYVDFFKLVRARYYVFSGTEPGREVYNALLEAKQTWDDKELEVTIIPTYDTDVLGYWVAENEELLTKWKIDLSPSASRCTINLQDHETSCSAYRLEF